MTRYAPQWIQAGDYPAGADRRLIGGIWPRAAANGMTVTPATGMTVNIAAGSVAIPTSNNTGTLYCSSDAVEQVTLTPSPPSGQNRYDVIVAQARAQDVDGGANNDWLFAVVTGSAGASPNPPATPANAVAIAQIYVPGASVTITAPNITDVRPSRLDVAWNSPWGLIAIGRATANVTGVSTVTDLVQSSNYQQIANRRYKVTAHIPQTLQQTAAGTTIVTLMDSQSQVRQAARITNMPATQGFPFHLTYEYEPTGALAGQYYKARISTTAGTVDTTMSAAQPGLVLVEDLGPIPGTPGT